MDVSKYRSAPLSGAFSRFVLTEQKEQKQNRRASFRRTFSITRGGIYFRGNFENVDEEGSSVRVEGGRGEGYTRKANHEP